MIVIYVHSRGKYEFHSWTTVTTIKPNVKLQFILFTCAVEVFTTCKYLSVNIANGLSKFELLVPPVNGKLFCDLFCWAARCRGKLKALDERNHFVFQPHNPATPGAMKVDPSFKLFMKKIFCPSSCHSKIQIPDHLLKLVLNLYAFLTNAARIKRQTSMSKLFCSNRLSNRRNQLNVEEVRSANQEREFLALDQSWASNFALFSSKIKKKYPLHWPISIQ